jgi:nucleoside-diphosphate kinase
MQRTFSIIKPDAVRKNVVGDILNRVERSGLRIVAMRKMTLRRADAEAIYAVHKGKPFFDSLVAFMTSGPVVVSVFEGKDAIAIYRALMGATDPAQAEKGTIRADHAESMSINAVHGSDSVESARYEMACVFSPADLSVASVVQTTAAA